MTPETETALQKAFWEAKVRHDTAAAKVQALRDQAAPLHAQIDTLRGQINKIGNRIKQFDAEIIESSREMSRMVNALNGKTGARPE